MTAIIIIGIIIFIIYASSRKKKKNNQNTTYKKSNERQKSEKEIKEELGKNLFKNIKVTVTTSETPKNHTDYSIIDVTNETLEQINDNRHSNSILPYNWKNVTIDSFDDIYRATQEQRDFYITFKQAFLRNIYIDLKGYTNYLHILYFDLVKEYDNGRDIRKLETLIIRLGLFYPVIKSYADSGLSIKKTNHSAFFSANQNYNTDYDYWGIGTKYKTQLKLTDNEVTLLNKLWYPSNNFYSIEYCCIAVLKFYLALISELKEKYIQEGTTMNAEFLSVADIIARKHFKYKSGSQNYKFCIETITKEFYSHIFKHCENAVREYYGHKRKVNTDTYYTTPEAKTEFETKIISKITELLPLLISKVVLPNEATEIELYSQSTNRWKIKFEELTTSYNEKPKEFIDSIISLGKLNKKNPSLENIFFEASKFIAKYDKQSALSLYVYYLYHDLKSATFDNKQLTKTIQKSLFKTNEQLRDFEIIVSELIKDKDLDKALKSVSKVYEVKRKKIQLNTASIKEVQQQHSGTVELLNEYLKDDFEDENNTIKSQEISSEEIKIEITQKNEELHQSAFLSELVFSEIHTTALELFAKSNFSVPQNELELFAKSKGIFKNQLVESINETCYDFLDDVLIEEEDDYYTINTNYFQSISAK